MAWRRGGSRGHTYGVLGGRLGVPRQRRKWLWSRGGRASDVPRARGRREEAIAPGGAGLRCGLGQCGDSSGNLRFRSLGVGLAHSRATADNSHPVLRRGPFIERNCPGFILRPGL